jgi:hypothetical protein
MKSQVKLKRKDRQPKNLRQEDKEEFILVFKRKESQLKKLS